MWLAIQAEAFAGEQFEAVLRWSTQGLVTIPRGTRRQVGSWTAKQEDPHGRVSEGRGDGSAVRSSLVLRRLRR